MPDEVKVMIVMTFFGSVAYWQLPPFFPNFCVRKNIDKAWVGFVMSANAACFLVAAWLTGNYLLKWMKRLNCAFFGSIFLVSKEQI